ncbi:PepSY domain-containing protein [Vagococcus entomophilus]|uniref:Peptidase n=1 Tax=Vagococcus entomophilus TaxID=1160095 RepID=A0A430AGE6_9ENTE|nr:PepSY domain-containing protein [Vagococcus entomophilus]RSU06970.1 peptidase [Vagococcus entomophilus]
MTNRKKSTLFTNGFALGLGSGIALGSLSTLWYQSKKTLSPDAILNKVKQAFLQEGPIEGSWINFEKKPRRVFAVRSKTYTGGIIRIEDCEKVQYEFIADAYTGTILDIHRL